MRSYIGAMPVLSVLDLSPIVAGSDAGAALRNSRDLLRHAEALGYHRYWLAEHHNMPGIASSATAVALAYAAEGSTRIRIGAGGIMLPNHAPLVIAEQFGTLASLFPGRVDLGLGRAPGTDQMTARALRRTLAGGGADTFPQDVLELMAYFEPAEPDQGIRAVPGAGTRVPVLILGSSLYGAQLAAALGLPFAFASHFAPGDLDEALLIYRRTFRPSATLERPYAIVACNVHCADTDEEARFLFTSQQQSFVNLRSGQPGPLPPPREGFLETLDPAWRAMLLRTLTFAFVGSPATVREGLRGFAERTQADEIIVAGAIFDHEARKRSYTLAAEAAAGLTRAAA